MKSVTQFCSILGFLAFSVSTWAGDAVSQAPQEASLEGRVYTNGVHQFRITLPDKWHVYGRNAAEILRSATAVATGEEAPLLQQPSYVLVALDPEPPNSRRSGLTLAVEDLSGLSERPTGADLLRAMESVPTGKSSMTFSPIAEESISGQLFFARTAALEVPTGKVNVVFYVTVHDNHAFMFNGGFQTIPQLDVILESIRSSRFLNPK